MDKIIFHRNNPQPSRGTMVIRVRPDAYLEIEKICQETGLSVADVASTLIKASLERVEIID